MGRWGGRKDDGGGTCGGGGVDVEWGGGEDVDWRAGGRGPALWRTADAGPDGDGAGERDGSGLSVWDDGAGTGVCGDEDTSVVSGLRGVEAAGERQMAAGAD